MNNERGTTLLYVWMYMKMLEKRLVRSRNNAGVGLEPGEYGRQLSRTSEKAKRYIKRVDSNYQRKSIEGSCEYNQSNRL